MYKIAVALSFLCWFMLPDSCLAQRDTFYFDQQWKKIPHKDTASYWRATERLKNDIYAVDDYFISGIKQMSGYFKTLASEEKTGHFIYYDTAGNQINEGDYLDGELTGEWKLYFPGTDTVWYSTTYRNGKLNGHATSYYKDGKVKRKETFLNDELEWGKRYATDGKEIKYTSFEVMPDPRWDITTYISKNTVYPMVCKRNGIEGQVIVRFYVDEQGKVREPVIIRSVHPLLDKEALKVVKNMRRWNPGMVDDEPVKIYFTLPVRFKVN